MNVQTGSAIKIANLEYAPNGFAYGLRQEFLKATLHLELPARPNWADIDEALVDLIPASCRNEETRIGSVLDRIIHWTAELQRSGNQLVLETGKVVRFHGNIKTAVVALPTCNVEATAGAVRIVVRLLSGLLDGSMPSEDVRNAARADCEKYIKHFSIKIIGGFSNTFHFLEAAHRSNMPWTRVWGPVFQIGMGSRARRLGSSVTDRTSAIGLSLARDKMAAAHVLRDAGLPAPMHARANSRLDAIRIAERLGYPVVVKPLDKDRGAGVAPDLKDEASVLKAFDATSKHSSAILVEKHFHGKDYRLVVFEGQLIWALERIPGGVTGDGVTTLRQLVSRLNQEPMRATRLPGSLKPLDLDDEASELLTENGMNFESVPEAGQWVRLRRAANVASGGMPRGVFEKVHPDNKLLAERAAQALGLDLAGIDLLIPDISRSWSETGAVICEVNAGPEIGYTTSAHLYAQMLKSMIKDDGRIPIALILGAHKGSPVPELVARILAGAEFRVGIATAWETRLNGCLLNNNPQNVFTSTRHLLLDKRTDAAVISASDLSVLRTYMPFDRCTVVALAGSHFEDADNRAAALASIAHALLPLALNNVVINADDSNCAGLSQSISGTRLILSSTKARPASYAGPDTGAVSVFMEGGPRDPRLIAGELTISLRPFDSSQLRNWCSFEYIALAASIALAMGCRPEHIRHGLGDL